MDDPLLMSVLHRLAHLDEEHEPLVRGEPVLVAVRRDRDARHVLHDEVRTARFGRAGVVHPGDVGMIHQSQGLALRLEPRDDLASVHALLDDLQSHAATDRLRLLREVHESHPPSPRTASSR